MTRDIGPWLPLLVVVPMAASALTVVLRRPLLERSLLLGVPAAGVVAGIGLVLTHLHTPVIAHRVGGFLPGVAISFASDMLSALMLTVTSATVGITVVFLILTREDRHRLFAALTLLLIGGVNGALVTADLFNLFVWVEVMLMPSYALIALTGYWTRLAIGRVFTLVNLATSTVLLIGIGLTYGAAGTVNLAALAGRGDEPAVVLGISVVMLALAIKAGLAPTHGWLPRTYPQTSAGVMALFSAVHTKVAIYAMFRISAVVFDAALPPWAPVLAVIVAVTIVLGALGTLGELRLRSALAWQMTSGVGHILTGLCLFTVLAVSASLYYMFHHMVTMAALLLAAGAIEHVYGSGRFDRLSGLLRREPVISALIAISMLSLAGLPPGSGLVGKVALIRAMADAGGWVGWLLIATVVAASLLTLIALQRMWGEVMWGRPMAKYRPDNPRTGRDREVPLPDDVRIPASLQVPVAVLVVASMAMLILAEPVLAATDVAARTLLDPTDYVAAVLR